MATEINNAETESMIRKFLELVATMKIMVHKNYAADCFTSCEHPLVDIAHTHARCFSVLSRVLRYSFFLPFILFKCEQMENCNTVPYLHTHGMITLPYQCFKFYSCFQVSVHRQHRVLNQCNSITKFYSSYDITDAVQSFT